MITRNVERIPERRERIRGGEGAGTLNAVTPFLPKNMRLFTEMRLEPGSSIGYHVHEGETEIFLFVSGQARVTDDDRVQTVYPGDALITPSGHGHAVEVLGDEEVVLYAAIVLD